MKLYLKRHHLLPPHVLNTRHPQLRAPLSLAAPHRLRRRIGPVGLSRHRGFRVRRRRASRADQRQLELSLHRQRKMSRHRLHRPQIDPIVKVLPEARAILFGRAIDPHSVCSKVLDAGCGGQVRTRKAVSPHDTEGRPCAPVVAHIDGEHPLRLVVGQNVQAARRVVEGGVRDPCDCRPPTDLHHFQSSHMSWS